MHEANKSHFYSQIADLVEGGLIRTACKLVERRLDLDPEDRDALRMLGRIKLKQGHPRQAAELLERSLGRTRHNRGDIERTPDLDSDVDWEEPDSDSHEIAASDIDYLLDAARSIQNTQNTFDIDNPYLAVETHRPAKLIVAPSGQEVTAPTIESDPPEQGVSEESDEDDFSFFTVINPIDEATPVPEIALEDLTDFLYDLEEQPEPSELHDVTVAGKVPRHVRAAQEAGVIGLQFEWTAEEIAVLKRVFEKHGWSSTKRVLLREITFGLTSAELDLADQVRDIWNARPEFSLSISGYAYPVLSWPLAIELVQKFSFCPDIEEIDFVLGEIYDTWYGTPSWHDDHGSFYVYLRRALSFPTERLSVAPAVTLASCCRYGDGYWVDDDYKSDVGFNTPVYDALADYGLLPDFWHEDGFRPTELAEDYG